jgi:hypothetical protein
MQAGRAQQHAGGPRKTVNSRGAARLWQTPGAIPADPAPQPAAALTRYQCARTKDGLPLAWSVSVVLHISRLIIAVCAIAVASPVTAQTYPYTGRFTFVSGSEASKTPQDAVKCAFTFFRQNVTGTGSEYVLDLDRYLATDEITYVKIDDFQCKFDDQTMTEVCSFNNYSTALVATESFAKIGKVDKTGVAITFLADRAEFEATISGEGGGAATTPPDRFVRCPVIDDAQMAPYLSDRPNYLSERAVQNALDFPYAPSGSALNAQTGKEILLRLNP